MKLRDIGCYDAFLFLFLTPRVGSRGTLLLEACHLTQGWTHILCHHCPQLLLQFPWSDPLSLHLGEGEQRLYLCFVEWPWLRALGLFLLGKTFSCENGVDRELCSQGLCLPSAMFLWGRGVTLWSGGLIHEEEKKNLPLGSSALSRPIEDFVHTTPALRGHPSCLLNYHTFSLLVWIVMRH